MPPDASAGAARPGRPRALLRLVAHDRGISALALAAVAGLAWAWLLAHGRSDAMAMEGHAPAIWSAGYVLPAFLMWALMMVAMMLPAAAPMILLYGRVAERWGGGHVAAFAGVYLALWMLFAAAAAVLQALLVAAGLVAESTLAVGDGRLAGALLLVAGLYELSPLKRACLDQCRSPLSFVMRYSRPGLAGAVRLGLVHGLYCLGCCWALMLLLFAGGVMDLALIGLLALLVAAEKLAPPRLRLSEAAGALLVLGGAALIAAG